MSQQFADAAEKNQAEPISLTRWDERPLLAGYEVSARTYGTDRWVYHREKAPWGGEICDGPPARAIAYL